MFVDTMTSWELMLEFLADKKELQDKNSAYCESSYVNGYVHKRRKLNKITLSRTVTSSRNNKYLCVTAIYPMKRNCSVEYLYETM